MLRTLNPAARYFQDIESNGPVSPAVLLPVDATRRRPIYVKYSR